MTSATQPTTAPVPAGARLARAITAALLLLWFVVTIGARPLAPIVATFVSSVEVALGLDVAGPRPG